MCCAMGFTKGYASLQVHLQRFMQSASNDFERAARFALTAALPTNPLPLSLWDEYTSLLCSGFHKHAGNKALHADQ